MPKMAQIIHNTSKYYTPQKMKEYNHCVGCPWATEIKPLDYSLPTPALPSTIHWCIHTITQNTGLLNTDMFT